MTVTPSPVSLLRVELARRGIELRATGDRLRYRPRCAMTPEIRQTIADHKAELLISLKTGWAESATRLIETCPYPEVCDRLTAFYDSAVNAATTIDGLGRADAERDSFGRLLVRILECLIGVELTRGQDG